MARYRIKDETDMAWNAIRRRITKEVRVQIAEVEERILNKLLGAAWEKFADSLEGGEIIELEAEYETFISRAIESHLKLDIEGLEDEVQDSKAA